MQHLPFLRLSLGLPFYFKCSPLTEATEVAEIIYAFKLCHLGRISSYRLLTQAHNVGLHTHIYAYMYIHTCTHIHKHTHIHKYTSHRSEIRGYLRPSMKICRKRQVERSCPGSTCRFQYPIRLPSQSTARCPAAETETQMNAYSADI